MPSKKREQQLLDRMWDRVRPLLPPRRPQPKGGRPFADDKACFAGIVYQLRNAIRWNDMPAQFPSGVTCWRRHRDWTAAGVWPKVWRRVLAELAAAGLLDATELFLDATFPSPTDAQREEVEPAVSRLVALTAERQSGRRAVLDWLRVEFDVTKPSQKLAAVAELSADGFVAEVRKHRGRSAPLRVAAVKQLNDEYAASVAPLQDIGQEAAALERRVSDAVNAAYGLNPDDVKLLWPTAPPRMPFSAE